MFNAVCFRRCVSHGIFAGGMLHVLEGVFHMVYLFAVCCMFQRVCFIWYICLRYVACDMFNVIFGCFIRYVSSGLFYAVCLYVACCMRCVVCATLYGVCGM